MTTTVKGLELVYWHGKAAIKGDAAAQIAQSNLEIMDGRRRVTEGGLTQWRHGRDQ